MPVKIKQWSKSFKWELSAEGLPIAPVYALGFGRWCQCPLCSCIHDCTADFNAGRYTYAPGCVGQNAHVWKNWRADWLKKCPEAANYCAVQLLGVLELAPTETTEPDAIADMSICVSPTAEPFTAICFSFEAERIAA